MGSAVLALFAVALATGPATAAPAETRRKLENPRWLTLPPPPAMPRTRATGFATTRDGAKLYWAEYGPAAAPAGRPVVVLLHGGLGNADHWAYQVRALDDDFRVIAIDSRGHGRSTLPRRGPPPSYRTMAGDVLAVLDARRVQRAAFVGWSDGGAIALALGVDHPERVDRLFVVGTNYDARGARPRTRPSPVFAAYAARCRADFVRFGRTAGYAAIAAAMRTAWRDPAAFTRDQLRAIRAPTVVADGDRDELVLLAQVEEMAALIPRGELRVFRDSSHFALWQDPETFNRALREFLLR